MLITHEIPAELLELEVTESAVMRYPELTLKTLHAIRALGVKLSIDDFGTGYASLAYLKQLPVQCLKIDKTFIDNLSTDEANQRIVKSAIHLAHEFSMIVVAEGVEQQSAAKILIDLGCELGQGYLYSKPLAPDLFEEIWLSNTLH
jgi:EAL domain-containing protein (putative c-di-GMP-specific phosphodiesterase class I)